MDSSGDQFDNANDLPHGLREDLAGLYRAKVKVPAEVDRAVLSSARARAAGRNRRRLIMRWAAGAAAVAAMAALVLKYLPMTNPPRQPVAQIAEDVNGDGRVDILDAYLLARRVEGRQQIEPRWDVNHDGTVDRQDVDAIAFAAVSLKRGAMR